MKPVQTCSMVVVSRKVIGAREVFMDLYDNKKEKRPLNKSHNNTIFFQVGF